MARGRSAEWAAQVLGTGCALACRSSGSPSRRGAAILWTARRARAAPEPRPRRAAAATDPRTGPRLRLQSRLGPHPHLFGALPHARHSLVQQLAQVQARTQGRRQPRARLIAAARLGGGASEQGCRWCGACNAVPPPPVNSCSRGRQGLRERMPPNQALSPPPCGRRAHPSPPPALPGPFRCPQGRPQWAAPLRNT
jgi:hypothetical protein